MTSPSDIAALILAAGCLDDDSSPLALGPWGSSTVVEHLVSIASEVVDTVVVVLGCDGERVAAAVDVGPAAVIIDPEWEEGIAAPLRAGLDTLGREAAIDHVVVMDATSPGLDRQLIEELLAAHGAVRHSVPGRRPGDGSATVAKFRYARSGPVVLARDLWERFLGIEGPTPILQTVAAHPDWVNEVWVDRVPPVEVHTNDDLAAIAPRR